MKFARLLAAGAMFAFLAACGDDESSFAPRDDNSSSSIEEESSSAGKSSSSIEEESSSSGKSSSSIEEESSSAGKSSSRLSSSVTPQSSSSETNESSSSVPTSYAQAEVKPLGTYDCSKYKCVTTEYLNQEFLESGKYGEFLDERDGQVYKTIQIGDQVWMAQNLNFNALLSSCYKDSIEKCEKFGRRYTWISAMDTARVFTTNAKGCGYDRICDPDMILPAQGVCPEGWHIPSSKEWTDLVEFVTGWSSSLSLTMLKSKKGWDTTGIGGNYKSNDTLGFSAIATHDEGQSVHFWTSTEKGRTKAYARYIWYNGGTPSTEYDKNEAYVSVRCIKGYAQKDTTWTKNSYAVVPSGTYDCTKYKCITTEYLNQEFLVSGKYGEVLDERDGHVYKTIQIGKQVWMAQNLNYKIIREGTYCYNNVQDSCDAMGGLYYWDDAKRVCPVRWHLATKDDWSNLLDYVGDVKSLLSQNEEDGTDSYGFSARNSADILRGSFSSNSNMLWTSTLARKDSSCAYRMGLGKYNSGLSDAPINYAYPIRCIENDPADPD